MATKQKMTKHQQEAQDAAESRRFLIIMAVSAVALMLLLYFVFA